MICPECRDIISDNCWRCAGTGWTNEDGEEWPPLDEFEKERDEVESEDDQDFDRNIGESCDD